MVLLGLQSNNEGSYQGCNAGKWISKHTAPIRSILVSNKWLVGEYYIHSPGG